MPQKTIPEKQNNNNKLLWNLFNHLGPIFKPIR